MSTNRHAFEHALRTSDEWLRSGAQKFGTHDLTFVQRAVRAWRHELRDELTVGPPDPARRVGVSHRTGRQRSAEEVRS